MWCCTWIRGALLACTFGISAALALKHVEASEAGRVKS
ncbi:cytochrome bd-I oxidase subunit CydX [Cronobacter sakazakii]|nr:cytochrome bd-I oxidase subunit CydX [Cronobacter sakazakii]PUW79552.1 cytochrome bd-I oxidase subunit CydX [Cronobacter sakazakii]